MKIEILNEGNLLQHEKMLLNKDFKSLDKITLESCPELANRVIIFVDQLRGIKGLKYECINYDEEKEVLVI